ncbi:WD40-repeat-containing domain protein [Elsinoe ampelina]|uniref:WD40-repeat-containing domain protein n=1 Tax=Elsinoe ampelina TaxID=302913 RepID=A0A6A6G9G1_9PEZI|nr:WD40-repeat-containing domain protein [Elsinoe ampelina]
MSESILKRKRPGGDVIRYDKPKKTVKVQAVNDKPSGLKKAQKALPVSHANGKSKPAAASTTSNKTNSPPSIQIVTGSYERVLHGFIATLPDKLPSSPSSSTTEFPQATFSDTFLFSAHSSSVRSLAISQPQASKRILATGSSDERINLYQLSTSAPSRSKSGPSKPDLPSLSGASVVENPRNRELGSLLHHSRTITSLLFPTKSKLFSAAEDNTIGITRTRDWTTLSTIKAPVPKPFGRPSGDTAAPGEVPSGVNDFAVHPSMKLMLSVSKGEKCMRLWNLVTGKKAGVLNFSKEVLMQIGEGRFSTGEGRRVLWRNDGEGFVVVFEKGVIVYGMESTPERIVRLQSGKICQARFVPGQDSVLAVSTEDGRVLFYDVGSNGDEVDEKSLPQCPCMAEIPTLEARSSGRIKDFEILELPESHQSTLIFITASSDGAARLWAVEKSSLDPPVAPNGVVSGKVDAIGKEVKSVGALIGVRETGNRLTCIVAFVMDEPTTDGAEESQPAEGLVVPNGDLDSESDEE